jgi:hypothetical protein
MPFPRIEPCTVARHNGARFWCVLSGLFLNGASLWGVRVLRVLFCVAFIQKQILARYLLYPGAWWLAWTRQSFVIAFAESFGPPYFNQH